MKFWDSSALVPLVSNESTTDTLNAIMAADPAVVVSPITPVEVDSAVWRKARQTRDEVARQRSLRRLSELRDRWIVVEEYAAVFEEARRMVARYGLRGGDAIQLATAIITRGNAVLVFVALDEDLKAAARAEGFPILP
ncbi:MAG TPA: type II toxin-antitoxin system VapC family toxin [Thermoanaerobaculia bacterium]|nr:type II toxin-antitoxin system VapC family toxin [Thermoanaerobaculia bacterium]